MSYLPFCNLSDMVYEITQEAVQVLFTNGIEFF